ncbi:response regulator [Christiangramia sediminis]|uniref:Response regulator n=1 Tax=Christiangramia sediminis TaxID=2881336 RepID=A0A9X1LL29_9FLAO|nr:response regulator [Christiangramia sediminis]MCB7482363.1 response regulator [Christiangramia sediminis]
MKKSIYVIDDDEIYQRIIKKLVARADVFQQASFYMNARKALHDLNFTNSEMPSVILLDINMPVMDGWQFLKELEKSFPNLYTQTKIFIVSSSIAYSDKEKINEFPMLSGFLSKPLSVEKLREIGEYIK